MTTPAAATKEDVKIIIQNGEAKAVFIPPSQDEVAAFRRTIETSDRSYILDAYAVPNLPEHLHGEWHGADSLSRLAMMERGFREGSEYLSEKNKMHRQADGTSTIGDTVFMVIEKWKYDIILENDRKEAARKAALDYDPGEESRLLGNEIGLSAIRGERSQGRQIDGSELNTLLRT